jgi:EmrB/QacA subfamily drug resistance transporter
MRPIAELDGRTKAIVMAGTLLGLFTSAMDQTIVSTSIPRIVADLGGFGLFSWLGTGFMLASTTTVPIVGKLTDLYGRKPFYMAGIFILILGSALAGSSQNVEQLIAFRVIQGLGAGMIMGIAFAIIGDVFTPAERGRWAGLMSGVFAGASVVGPLIGGTLTDHVHWRWVFYVNLPLGGLALAVLLVGMPNMRPPLRSKLDRRGLVLLVATVVPLLLAFSWAGSRYDWDSFRILGILAWAAVGLVLFVYAELRAQEPLFPMHLFRNHVFTVSALVTLISGFAMMGSLFYIPLFVQGVIGTSATNSGLVTMPMMIAMSIASAVAGQVMSRFGRYRVLGVIGLMVMVGGAIMLSRMDVNATLFDARLAMVVFGIGLGTSMPLFMLAVQNAVPYRFMGIATSSMQFLRSVGGTMGVAILFSIIQSQYHESLVRTIPREVQQEPALSQALRDPQFLLNARAFQQVREGFLQFGDRSEVLFAQTIMGVRESLAGGIGDAFFISIFVLVAAVVVGVFMKEIPLRRTHLTPEEALSASAEPVASGIPVPALPIAGASNGPQQPAPAVPGASLVRSGTIRRLFLPLALLVGLLTVVFLHSRKGS